MFNFYHSFSRRSRNENSSLKVLDLMCKNGLLLTPEILIWADLIDPSKTHSTTVEQKRICFTELSETQLADHSKIFGSFALEFPHDCFRKIGGMPVFYIRSKLDSSGFYSDPVSNHFLSNLSYPIRLLNSLVDAREYINNHNDGFGMTMVKDGSASYHDFDPEAAEAIGRYLTTLEERLSIRKFIDVRNGIQTMSSLFYPTDNARSETPLGYYQQREWRIIGGIGQVYLASDEQIKELISLDEEFFGKKHDFISYGERIFASECAFLKLVENEHVLTYASRLLVPSDALASAREVLSSHGINLPVDALPFPESAITLKVRELERSGITIPKLLVHSAVLMIFDILRKIRIYLRRTLLRK
jgi:hypothetical protein